MELNSTVRRWIWLPLTILFLALVAWCADKLGRDRRLVLAFVALNPVYLVYAVGGFHFYLSAL